MNFLDSIASRINLVLEWLENRVGLLPATLIIGLLILGFDMLYIEPVFKPAFNGPHFVRLSENPFDFASGNPFQYRILPSVIAWATGFRGEYFVAFPLIFTWFLISGIYHWCRKSSSTPIDALLITGLIAGSCTVFIQLISPAYTDAFIYFFVFLAFVNTTKPFLASLFFGIALLSHEVVLFLLPGLVLYSWWVNKNELGKNKKLYLGLLIAIVSFCMMRYSISLYATVKNDFGYYLSIRNIRDNIYLIRDLVPIGAFYAFRLFWVLPLFALISLAMERKTGLLAVILAILIGAGSQLLISYDITRHICLAFPAILIAAVELKRRWPGQEFTRFMLVLAICNPLIIPCYVSPAGIHKLVGSVL